MKMDKQTIELSRELHLNSGAPIELLRRIQSELGTLFPADYIEFMSNSNGANGFIGESYLKMWPVEDVLERNKLHISDDLATNLILFGSDGGGIGYAFDTSSPKETIVWVDFVVMDPKETKILGFTILEFFEYLYKCT